VEPVSEKEAVFLAQGKRRLMRQLKTWLILLAKVFDNQSC
jgi:hypothetical protein